MPVRLATVGATEASQMAYGWALSIPLEMCCLGLNVSYSFNLTTRLIGLHFWILPLHLKKKKKARDTVLKACHSTQSVSKVVSQ